LGADSIESPGLESGDVVGGACDVRAVDAATEADATEEAVGRGDVAHVRDLQRVHRRRREVEPIRESGKWQRRGERQVAEEGERGERGEGRGESAACQGHWPKAHTFPSWNAQTPIVQSSEAVTNVAPFGCTSSALIHRACAAICTQREHETRS
jgi:hypothetical protein